MWQRLGACSLGACSVLLALATGLGSPAGAAGEAPPAGPSAAVLVAAAVEGSTAAAPTPAGIRKAVGRIVSSDFLGRAGASVIDPATMTVLLDSTASTALVPGSVLKLITAASALVNLGPLARIPTTVVASDSVVTLVGGGDATLAVRGGGPGAASLADLAKQVAAQVQAGPIDLRYDDSLFTGPELGPGWARDYPAVGVAAPVTALMVDQGRVRPGAISRVPNPAKSAARTFRRLLEANGVTVRSLKPGRADAGATQIAKVESAPIIDLVEFMLTTSDNDLAESLAHLSGAAAGFKASFAGGSKAAVVTLADLGIDSSGMELVDGSGVSARNRVSAATLTELLALVARGTNPDLSPIASGLAVAGFTGTLTDRFVGENRPAAGYVRAKTGTLTGVTSLAGTVQDVDGRVLVFALLANQIPSIERARDLGDDFASSLAACGCS